MHISLASDYRRTKNEHERIMARIRLHRTIKQFTIYGIGLIVLVFGISTFQVLPLGARFVLGVMLGSMVGEYVVKAERAFV